MKSPSKSISQRKLLSRYLPAFALLMSTSGCSTNPAPRPSEPYQVILMAECPETLPRLTGNTGAHFDEVLRPLRSMYTTCAARHNQLVREIKQRESIK